MTHSNSKWRIFNPDGCPVSDIFSTEEEAWLKYLRALGVHEIVAYRYRHRLEREGWKAIRIDDPEYTRHEK